ncbi:hypothetical protein VTI74DRAFT_5115 [Chaetomium olivicolor]
MREMHSRGWWERLWVIQEVALATAPVQMQCGNNTPADHFLAVVKDFRFSERGEVPEAQQSIAKLVMLGMTWVFEQLEPVFLRSAERFKGYEDRDGFYAVLGITVGVSTGSNSKARNFVRYFSADTTGMVLARVFELLYDSLDTTGGAVGTALILALGTWRSYYDSCFRHWAINRAEDVVADLDEFFILLAPYIAARTRALAILDAAHCDQEMPSWIPNWAREIGDPVHHFAIR